MLGFQSSAFSADSVFFKLLPVQCVWNTKRFTQHHRMKISIALDSFRKKKKKLLPPETVLARAFQLNFFINSIIGEYSI